MSSLYIVATPIGNLGDITLRALEALKKSDVILCEDTRQTKKLLSHFNISKKCIAFHKFSTEKEIDFILNMCNTHDHVALVSDAGTPAISDPGSFLIKKIRESHLDINIVTIPGPSALTAALSISGLLLSQFTFVGFLPHKKGRQKKLDEILELNHAVVLYESTHRIKKLLEEINLRQSDRKIILCKELTKIHEQVLHGVAQDILDQLVKNPSLQKGEFVLICE